MFLISDGGTVFVMHLQGNHQNQFVVRIIFIDFCIIRRNIDIFVLKYIFFSNSMGLVSLTTYMRALRWVQDGALLIANCLRDVRFLVAAVSMKRPIVGQLARACNAIPVERPQDMATLVMCHRRAQSPASLCFAHMMFPMSSTGRWDSDTGRQGGDRAGKQVHDRVQRRRFDHHQGM